MRLIYADYNPLTNSIDVTTFENYILRIDCNKAEDGLRTTLCSQNSLNALAIDEPLEYARLALDGEMQAGWMRLIVWQSGDFYKCFLIKCWQNIQAWCDKIKEINLLENYRVGDIWQFNSFAYYVRDKAILGEEIYSGIIS